MSFNTGWTMQDARELQALRIAVADIRDAYLASTLPPDDHDEPANPEHGTCPNCWGNKTFNVAAFGTPAHVEEHLCGECRCSWTIRRPVEEQGSVGESSTGSAA